MRGGSPYSFEDPFLYEMTRLPSSFTCSTAPLLPCVITFCEDAELPEEEERAAATGAASAGAFDELANESVDARLSEERNGCCGCCFRGE